MGRKAPAPGGERPRAFRMAVSFVFGRGGTTGSANQVFWQGWAGHEPETTTLFFALAQKVNSIIDVGDYVGYYALLAAHANPAAKVLALEPLAASTPGLCDTFRKTGFRTWSA